jgi:hypothetical protein
MDNAPDDLMVPDENPLDTTEKDEGAAQGGAGAEGGGTSN